MSFKSEFTPWITSTLASQTTEAQIGEMSDNTDYTDNDLDTVDETKSGVNLIITTTDTDVIYRTTLETGDAIGDDINAIKIDIDSGTTMTISKHTTIVGKTNTQTVEYEQRNSFIIG